MDIKMRFQLLIAALILMTFILACDLTSTTVDCSVPDLIAKINTANSNPAASTLELAAGCTYTLTAVDNTATSSFDGSTFEYGDNGLPQISTEIIINGNGAIIERASSAPNFRIFFITDTGNLTINDLSLQNGIANETGTAFPSSGGAIYNDGAYLEVNNSTLQNNQAGFHGGAIFGISNAATYINGSTVQNNSAPHGGGIFIYHEGLLSVDNSEISNNSASTSGGGIGLEYGTELIVSDSLIASNTAGRHGGGIFKDSGPDRLPTTITGTTFQDNTADWSGGGVFIWRTPLTISDSHFINNQADEYGGGLGYQNNSTESVMISNSTFDGNTAGWDGGAIHFSGESMSISNSDIMHNISVNGAGIHNGPADDSKYIIRADTTLIFTGGTVQENVASGDGGGAFNEGVMTCGEANFIANESSTKGGGIYNTGNLEVIGCTFDKNTTGMAGGGINNEDTAEIRVSIIKNNTANQGGGVYNNGSMVVSQSTFSGNEVDTLGGGIHNVRELNVEDSTFEGNMAGADGGGINTYSYAIITGSTFDGNTAFRGGGLASVGGNTTLTNDTISANQATDSGGGIFNMGPLIGDTTPGGSMDASNITVAYNNAPAGGGIAATGGMLKIKNSIVALNVSGNDCLATSVDMTGLGENIDSDGTCPGFTLKDDPILDVLANYGGPTATHALKSGSPAIDAAPDCTTVGGAVVAVDQRGHARPGGAVCDLGAYEDEAGLPVQKQTPCTFTALVNLNCRLGPDDTIYPVVDSFKAGESAQVVGQSWDKVFAYVEGPINKLVCAVPATAKFGTLEGDCEEIPVMEAPDVDETYDEDEPTGCTIMDQSGKLTCVVPCPKDAKPGDPCTP